MKTIKYFVSLIFTLCVGLSYCFNTWIYFIIGFCGLILYSFIIAAINYFKEKNLEGREL